ncbi:uncharacterized protein LOC115683020 isoform X2 [Syzygium oleosum]|uniref:uncharacterized protein LOC115683020 isoform X2 n=1 Tax=Syzygium oleosum TaxID=219896 RepID=UPI0024BA13D5|nr:uncharacterized protein LOC115683020 isoform X2 [Syzygium oleosum]
MGGRGRSRTQRRHFAQGRENVWKRPKSDPNPDANPDAGNGNGNGNGAGNAGGDASWQPFATQNLAFDEYYKGQGIVSQEEWDAFVECLRKPLPAAFRINSSSQFWMDIRSQLENDFAKSLQAEFIEGDEVQAIRPLAWYPENLAWHSNFSRMQLRKNQALERFHEFLKLENEIGNITRQEAVSMVPPLFLDVQPDHFVLDMCAAPGSKTFQLLEIIHRSTKPGSLPKGLVIANDLDVQRCNLLIHQTKRMCTANLAVTNHEAQQFPGCRLSKSQFDTSEMGNQLGPCLNQLLFDRVLCDVPCSGDGTLRKAPDIWRKWNTGMGNGIHGLQIQIAMRGISLLKVGGRMVYSTCSMNPIENEAVVAEILRKCGGCVELLDVSGELPQLIQRPGLKKWKVRDKGTWLASYKNVPLSRRGAVHPSMFPSGSSVEPVDHSVGLEEEHQNGHATSSEDPRIQFDEPVTLVNNLEEEVSTFPLERCMRIVPHDQNGGAFFIAVFHKVGPLPGTLEKHNSHQEKSSFHSDRQSDEAQDKLFKDVRTSEDISANGNNEKVAEAALEACEDGPQEALLETDSGNACGNDDSKEAEAPSEENDGKAGGKRKLQIQGKWRGVDPVVFFRDEDVVNSIKNFYGIVDSFPLSDHLVTRNSETTRVKRIYYVSESVKELLELNFKVGQQLKITSIGLKMFERQTSREGTSAPCLFRISSEGLPLILPYLTKQILDASVADFKHLLQYKSIKFTDFVDAEFSEKATKLLPGCCVIVLWKDNEDSSNPNLVHESPIAIGCWRGKASLSVMVTAIDCQELLERLLLRMEPMKESTVQESEPLKDANEVNNSDMVEDADEITLNAES